DAEPRGVYMSDLVTLEALDRAGIATVDAQRVMLKARKLKTEDEKALLDHAAAIVDAVYDRSRMIEQRLLVLGLELAGLQHHTLRVHRRDPGAVERLQGDQIGHVDAARLGV